MLLMGAVGARAAEAYAYFDSSDGSLNFCYDNNRSSNSSKYTVFSLNTGSNNPAWRSIASSVKELYFFSNFANYKPTSCYGWARDMTNLTKVTNIKNLNTTNVTTMAYMFKDCSSLKSLDLNLNNFVTTNVTSMGYMFYGCSSLTKINMASNFNTSNVTDFGFMFNGCSSLTSLDVSYFNTAKATYMASMFRNCSGLTSIDVSKFNTENAKLWLNEIFVGCSKLTSLDLSSFTIGTANAMLSGCSSLANLKVPSSANNLASNACTGVGTASKPCVLDFPDGFTPNGIGQGNGYITWKSGYFKDVLRPYAVFSGSTLTFYYDSQGIFRSGTIYKMNTGNSYPGWHENSASISEVVFDSSFANTRPTSCASWFMDMKNLKGITGLNLLNTSNVTTMQYMFSGCHKLLHVNLSLFDTSKVNNMLCMFDACESLSSLDVSSFDTSNVTTMYGMFGLCTNLKSISFGDGFDTSKVTGGFLNNGGFYMMFTNDTSLTNLDLSRFTFSESATTDNMIYGCKALMNLMIPKTANRLSSNACQGVGTQDAPCTLVYPAGFTPEKTSTGDGWYEWKSGYFKDAINEAYALLSTDEKTLTFYYDKYKFSRPGNSYELNIQNTPPAWYSSVSSVTSVVFDASFADARPTSCCQWFAGMDNLTTIRDIDNLRTDEVTSMRSMFQGCSNLAILDVSGFSTSNVEIMTSMFSGCSSLESLDVSGFDTRKVTDMSYMFHGCSSLTSLDVRGFDTKKVTNMSSMFTDCSSLTSLDLSKFTFKDNIRTNYFLYFCSGLQTLIIPASAGNLNGNACSNVGSRYAPCALVYPTGFTPEKTSTGDGWYEWKSGYFKDAFKKGDANGDGSVSVSDVMMTVNSVLGSTPPDGFYFDNANVNGDKVITVADVMAIVEIVLSNTSNNAPAHSRYSGADGIALSANDGHCTVVLDNSEPFTALQFTIVMPEGAELGNVAMMQARSDGHLVKMQAVAPGRYNMMVFAPSGAPLRDGTTALLHFDFSGCQPGDIAIEGTQLVNSQYETVLPTGVVTAITGIEADGAADAQPYYNTVGVKVKTPSRGVYIKNGKKVVVK